MCLAQFDPPSRSFSRAVAHSRGRRCIRSAGRSELLGVRTRLLTRGAFSQRSHRGCINERGGLARCNAIHRRCAGVPVPRIALRPATQFRARLSAHLPFSRHGGAYSRGPRGSRPAAGAHLHGGGPLRRARPAAQPLPLHLRLRRVQPGGDRAVLRLVDGPPATHPAGARGGALAHCRAATCTAPRRDARTPPPSRARRTCAPTAAWRSPPRSGCARSCTGLQWRTASSSWATTCSSRCGVPASRSSPPTRGSWRESCGPGLSWSLRLQPALPVLDGSGQIDAVVGATTQSCSALAEVAWHERTYLSS